jgi:hypothetical protein
MPRVGNREFPYTAAGKRNAARFASATGRDVQDGGRNTRGQNLGRLNPYPGPGRPGPFVGGRNTGPNNAIRRPGPGIAPPRGGLRGGLGSSPGLDRRGGSRVMRNPGLGRRKLGTGDSITPGFSRRRQRPGRTY